MALEKQWIYFCFLNMNKINPRLGLLDLDSNRYKETNASNSKTWRKKYEYNLMSWQEQSWHGIGDFIEPESLLLKLFNWPKTVQPTPSECRVKRNVNLYSGQSYNKKIKCWVIFHWYHCIVDIFLLLCTVSDQNVGEQNYLQPFFLYGSK